MCTSVSIVDVLCIPLHAQIPVIEQYRVSAIIIAKAV